MTYCSSFIIQVICSCSHFRICKRTGAQGDDFHIHTKAALDSQLILGTQASFNDFKSVIYPILSKLQDAMHRKARLLFGNLCVHHNFASHHSQFLFLASTNFWLTITCFACPHYLQFHPPCRAVVRLPISCTSPCGSLPPCLACDAWADSSRSGIPRNTAAPLPTLKRINPSFA